MKPSFLQQFLENLSKPVISRLSWAYVGGFSKTTVNLDASSQELIYKVETGQIVFDGPFDQNYTDYCNTYHDALDRVIGIDQSGDLITETTENLHNKFYEKYIGEQLSDLVRNFKAWRLGLVGAPGDRILTAFKDCELSILFCKVELTGYVHITAYHRHIDQALNNIQMELTSLKTSLFPSTQPNQKSSMEDILPVIVILTALKEEYSAVRQHLSELSDDNKNGTLYEKGIFSFDGTAIAQVIIRECGQRNTVAAQETERAIQGYKPDGLVFVGIAGSRKPNDFKVGDVIVADKIYSYEGGRSEEGQFLARPDLAESSFDIVEMAKVVRRGEDWKKLIKGGFDSSGVMADIGTIASGEKLIEHFDSTAGKVLTAHYNDTQAVEMEGFGFAKTAVRQGRASSHMMIGVVRGISDILETKSRGELAENPKDKRPEHVKELASATAAAFTYYLMYKLFVNHKKKSEIRKHRAAFLTPETESYLGSGQAVVGRADELSALKEQMDRYQKVVVVNGMGGVGKTTLAKYFIDHYHSDYTAVLWVNAAAGIKKGFVNGELISSMGLMDKLQGLSLDGQFDMILSALRQIEPAHSLLIIDNMDRRMEKAVSEKILLRPNWKVMLTSRFKFAGYQPFDVQPLLQDQCIGLFFRHYTREGDTGQTRLIVTRIVQTVFRHTLTIELLAKTAQYNKKFSLSSLWAEVEKNGLSTNLDVDIGTDYNRVKDAKTSITKCLSLAFSLSDLNNDLYKRDVLGYLSVLPPSQIEYQTAKKLFRISESGENKFINTLNDLVQRGWLEEESASAHTYYYMHPMIQDTIRKKLKPSLESLTDYIETLTGLITAGHHLNEPENLTLYAPFVERVIARFEKKDSLSIARLCYAFSVLVRDFYGDLAKAIIFSRRALDIRLALAPNSDELSESYNNYAVALRRLGGSQQLLEAERYNQLSIESLEKRNLKNTEYYKLLATFYNTKGQIINSIALNDVTKRHQAIRIFKEALSLLTDRQIDYPHLEATLNDNIGHTFSLRLEQHSAGLPYLQKAVTLGELSKDPHVLTYYTNLANCYFDLGLADAKYLTPAVETIRKAVSFYESLPNKDMNSNLAIAYGLCAEILVSIYNKTADENAFEEAVRLQYSANLIKERLYEQSKSDAHKISLGVAYNGTAKMLLVKGSPEDLKKARTYATTASQYFTEAGHQKNLAAATAVLELIRKRMGEQPGY